ncbi:MAG: response regulator, partial [Rhodanobacter sp.]
MMRIVVIDDEPLAREGVIARLQSQADVILVGQYGDCDDAAAGLARDQPDLVFIDVQMPGITGLDWLASVPLADRPMAVMLTAYDAYAVRAFELQAIDYLLKPIDDQRFSEALDRARQALPYRRQMTTGSRGSESNEEAVLE